MNGYRYTRLTIFHVVWFFGLLIGLGVGGCVGYKHFGILGAILGAIIGGACGILPGSLLDHWANQSFFSDLKNSSNEKLKANLDRPEWNFLQTMSLLQLAARGEPVESALPRIFAMLEADSKLERTYGWDALRIVFTEKYQLIKDYDPNQSAEECRKIVARIRPPANSENLQSSSVN